MLRYLTAGETHGKCLITIVEGMPSNLPVNKDKINFHLAERQKGYGRGGRMKIETDTVEILSGVRDKKTLGSPVALSIQNLDWENWESKMTPDAVIGCAKVTRPRPGHADLTGALKYDQEDIRNVLERASARETAAKTAAGSLARQLLERFGIKIASHVVKLGNVCASREFNTQSLAKSQLRCCDQTAEKAMIEYIEKCKQEGTSVGGVFEVIVTGLPPGLGSYVHWDRKMDARLSYALMGIQAIKGVEIGKGFEMASLPGHLVHDEIFYSEQKGYYRKTNNCGGIEGGMTNGEPVVIRCAMKPIPTLYKPIFSVDINTHEPFEACVERSDVCAVPAAAVVGEAVAAFVLAQAFLEKFGSDSIEELKRNYDSYMAYLR